MKGYCFDFYKTEEEISVSKSVNGNDDDSGVCSKTRRGKRERRRWRRTEKKEFPPPMPSPTRTENLFFHMRWVLKRYYTSDGRLILTAEKVRHHEYFRVHRSNGRLTLHLVLVDDDFDLADNDEIEDDEVDHEEAKEEEAEVEVLDSNINNAEEYDEESSDVETLIQDDDPLLEDNQ